jgi:hypothetical protein
LKLRKAVVAGSGEAVVEYIAELAGEKASGEASVKIVYAENPAKALRAFYERERETA